MGLSRGGQDVRKAMKRIERPAQLALAVSERRALTMEEIAVRVRRLNATSMECWLSLCTANRAAYDRDVLLANLRSPDLRNDPRWTKAMLRAIDHEMQIRHALLTAACAERWGADPAWQSLTPQERHQYGMDIAWGADADQESLAGQTWRAWPEFHWPPGFDWAKEVGHLGWHEVAIWLQATGKSPPDPPRLGPALQLAIAEGLKV